MSGPYSEVKKFFVPSQISRSFYNTMVSARTVKQMKPESFIPNGDRKAILLPRINAHNTSYTVFWMFSSHSHAFSTSIYRKKTFTGLYTKWDSFTPRKYKINLIRTLTFRCFRICSSSSLLRSSLSELRKLLSQNGYPAGIVNYNINDVLNRQKQAKGTNHHCP